MENNKQTKLKELILKDIEYVKEFNTMMNNLQNFLDVYSEHHVDCVNYWENNFDFDNKLIIQMDNVNKLLLVNKPYKNSNQINDIYLAENFNIEEYSYISLVNENIDVETDIPSKLTSTSPEFEIDELVKIEGDTYGTIKRVFWDHHLNDWSYFVKIDIFEKAIEVNGSQITKCKNKKS